MPDKCKTKYPIMLIHGIGYNDADHPEYWGRIPEILRENGAEIYFGGQDGFGNVTHNAEQLKTAMQKTLAAAGAEKLNLIAHSKGGVEARYALTKLGMGSKAASLTTMATPHRGIMTIDKMKIKPGKGPLKFLYRIFGMMLRIDGGELPETDDVYDQLTADYMKVFNDMVRDVPGVYYQSYAFDMKNSYSDPAMGLFYSIVEKNEGSNDGLVSVESAKWGDFRGIVGGIGAQGISHPKAVDGNKKPVDGPVHLHYSRRENGTMRYSYSDITDFYIDMVSRLADMGL